VCGETQLLIMQAGTKRKQGDGSNDESPAEMARAFLEQNFGKVGPKKAK